MSKNEESGMTDYQYKCMKVSSHCETANPNKAVTHKDRL